MPRYILTVEARDSPTPSGTSRSTYVQVGICLFIPHLFLSFSSRLRHPSPLLQVDITVEDTNDNTPDFGTSSFVYNVTENAAAGTVLAPTLLATDTDEGTNGQVVYSISSGPFTVDANTGMEDFLLPPFFFPLLLVSPFLSLLHLLLHLLPPPLPSRIEGVIQVSDSALLDREMMPVFNQILTAQDRGPFPHASTANIRIVLTDVNDNPPIFEETIYRAEITEVGVCHCMLV